MKLFFAELKKLIKNSVVVTVAAMLLFVCAAAALYGTTLRQYTPQTAEELQQSYKTQTEAFIKTAEHKRREAQRLGAGENSYTYKYYTRIIDIYSEANKNVTIENGSAKGWDNVLGSDAVLILSLIGAAVIGAVAVYEERRTGAELIIRAAKNGRGRTNVCKFISVMLTSAALCLIISVVYFSAFYLTGSLSDGSAELQTAYEFAYSPYKITLLRAFTALTLQRMTVAAAMGAVFAQISCCLNSYISIFASGAVLCGVEFALFKINFKSVDVFVKNVNVFSLGTPYFLKRYYSVRLFGEAGAFEISVAVAALIAAAVTVFAAFVNVKTVPVRKKTKRFEFRHKEKSASPHGVFYWELRKRVLTPLMIAVLAAALALRIFVSFYTLKTNVTVNEQIYHEYCSVFLQKDLNGARDAIYTESERVENGLGMKNEANRLKANNEITDEEYEKMIFEYEYSSARSRIIEICEKRLAYLYSVRTEDNNVRFVYDTPVEKLLYSDFDVVLVLLLIVCLSASFSSEKELGVYSVMRSTKNGGLVSFAAKLGSAALITAVLFAAFTAVDLFVLGSCGGFESLSASAVSLEAASKVDPRMSIGELFAFIYLLKFVSSLAFSVLIMSVSGLTNKTLAAAAISACAVMVPYGVRTLSKIAFPSDLSALMSGSVTALKGGAWFYDLIPLAVTAVLLTVLGFVNTRRA